MTNRFALDRNQVKLLGVCAGLSNWTGIDALWIRVAFVGLTLVGFGWPVLLYLAIGLLAR